MRKPRILLADDHTLVREGMHSILQSDFEVVGQARDGMELVRMATELQPDVIVADIAMPNMNGLEAIRHLKKENLQAKFIFLTMHTGVEIAVQALRLGASGYILKVDASNELIRAIQEALEGRMFITPSIAKDVMMVLMEGSKDSLQIDELLTSREREVLQLVAEGNKMAEIGDILHISPRTVERHKYNLMDKLKLHTTAELVQFAIKHGIITQA